MRITNKLNLPLPLVRAVTQTRHESNPAPNTIRVSELIKPPQLRALAIKHDTEISEDASDRIWSLLGTLLHDILEKNAKGLDNHTTEEELSIEVNGYKIIGHYDLTELVLDSETLTDWKLTSIYALKENEPAKPEWIAQINIYAELLRCAGRPVSKGQIVAIGRDWSKSRATRESDYPQKQVLIKPVPLWNTTTVYKYLQERVNLHHDALTLGIWPECTDEERWYTGDKFALTKKGNKKATKLFDAADAAAKYQTQNDMINGYEVQYRAGTNKRCDAYCVVAPFCPQRKKQNHGQRPTKMKLGLFS